MSVEKLNDELEFAASQGPDVAVMTAQETVRAVLAEVGVVYVLANGSHVTGERAVDLYDDENERCRRVSAELADCRADRDIWQKTAEDWAARHDALFLELCKARGVIAPSSPNAAYQPVGGEASTETKSNERKP